MRVFERFGLSRPGAEIDPVYFRNAINLIPHHLDRISKIKANGDELHNLRKKADPTDRDDADYSKEFIIVDGVKARIEMQKKRFEEEKRGCIGAKVIIKKIKDSPGTPHAYDGGIGEGFDLEDGETITGEVENLFLDDNGTISLEKTLPSRWPEHEQHPNSPFEIRDLYALDDNGALQPNFEIELVE